MVDDAVLLLNALNANEVYEGVDQYSPDLEDFYKPVQALLPAQWSLKRESIWIHCNCPDSLASLPDQGWKLHLSTEAQRSLDLLKLIVPELIASGTVFKFAADRRILYLLNCKRWPRGGAGKFVTIYPENVTLFAALADRLAALTDGLAGPYILSDRRYRNSKTVYYRYGGFRNISRVNVDGTRDHYVIAPDGRWMKDIRHPYFAVPDWVTDPFADSEISSDNTIEENSLQSGRFRIENAIVFSNAGGIYKAIDNMDGNRVLVKEARPYVYTLGTSQYATELLAREYGMLWRLAKLDVAPKPVSHFVEWEHHFLVEELIEGPTLATHIAATNILLYTDPTPEQRRAYLEDYYTIAIQLCTLLQKIHNEGITFGDLSPNNILIRSDDSTLRVIDLESAASTGEQDSPPLFTPGFAKPRTEHARRPQDDYFALGNILASMLFPFNRLFTLDESITESIICETACDAGFPAEIPQIIKHLLEDEATGCAGLSNIIAQFEDLRCRLDDPAKSCGYSELIVESTEDSDIRYEGIIEDLLSYIRHHIDYSRADRLFPAAVDVLRKNPHCIGNGIAGLAEVLMMVEGKVPTPMHNRLSELTVTEDLLPPGLLSGRAGIAAVMWDCGLHDIALSHASAFCADPRIFKDPFFENGLSGAGIAALDLYEKSSSLALLEFAKSAGDYLIQIAEKEEDGLHWVSEQWDYGLGNGSSGVALFFLYLYLATKLEKYLDAGQAALRFDIAAGVNTRNDGLSWRHRSSNSGVVYPYWLHGSAGVGEVVLRYLVVTRDARYRDLLEKICRETSIKYALFPGIIDGLSGIGHFLLNCAWLLEEPAYAVQARNIASGIRLQLIRRPEGLAVCGDRLGRISCDYSTGSAGVISFLWRLSHQTTMPLFPDNLISERLQGIALVETSIS